MDVLCPILVLAAVKYEDMVTLKHRRVTISITCLPPHMYALT